jgi:hypothetical protein
MKNFMRILFVVQFLLISAYTIFVVSNYGANLFKVFLGDIFSFSWAGQFNFDFWNYLLLSAIWVAWREKFTSKGIILALIAHVFGMMFLAPYLLHLSIKTNGDTKKMLIGDR